MSAISIEPIAPDHAGFDRLRREAAREGFRFFDRLVAEWTADPGRFRQPGDLVVGALDAGTLLGVCCLEQDRSREGDPAIARLRHLYVLPQARRRGIGAALVRHVIDDARGRYRVLRLRTDTEAAAAFYVRLGFASVDDATATHLVALQNGKGNSEGTRDHSR
ncbi:GNAT family N-acetyltransferase [Salinarimonas soli]|uniref:GNAT family N-acetyltransferase n=1 Tax=Salinarimonas soli TaxID=1638099 RepID=A0A5B2VCV6_9HYPH|nr:GNAT family N-acetyltransferase [Salinarimonas soli]KAA2237313.1 GNAT family N-acetyltransferase [Salinarimonas soli]